MNTIMGKFSKKIHSTIAILQKSHSCPQFSIKPGMIVDILPIIEGLFHIFLDILRSFANFAIWCGLYPFV